MIVVIVDLVTSYTGYLTNAVSYKLSCNRAQSHSHFQSKPIAYDKQISDSCDVKSITMLEMIDLLFSGIVLLPK